MSDALILGLATLITGIVSPLLILWVKWRLDKKVDKVHDLVNDKMSQLLKVTESDATMKGKEAGKKEERKEAKQRDK